MITTTRHADGSYTVFIPARRDGRAKLEALKIIDAIANEAKVAVSDLLGRARPKFLVEIRFAAIRIVRERLGLGLVPIAQLFGGRDHHAIHHALKASDAWLETDPEFRALYTRCQRACSPSVNVQP